MPRARFSVAAGTAGSVDAFSMWDVARLLCCIHGPATVAGGGMILSGNQQFTPIFPTVDGIAALRNAHDLANVSHTRHHAVRATSSRVMLWDPPMAVATVVHTATLISALRLLAASIALANAACTALLQRQQPSSGATPVHMPRAEQSLQTFKPACT